MLPGECGRLTIYRDENTDGVQEIVLLYDLVSLDAVFVVYTNTRDVIMGIDVTNFKHQRTIVKLPPTLHGPMTLRLSPGRFKVEKLVGEVVTHREATLRVFQEPRGSTAWR